MSTILSLKEIRELTFEPLPRKPRKVSKMVSTGKTVVFVEGKTVYTNRMEKNLCWPPGSEPWWFDEVWSCLKKLGVLSASVIEEHRKAIKDAEEKRERKHAARNMLENAKKAGVVLTAEQKKVLDKIGKSE